MKFSEIHIVTKVTVILAIAGVGYLFYLDYENRNRLYRQIESVSLSAQPMSEEDSLASEPEPDSAHIAEILSSLVELENQVVELQNQSTLSIWWDRGLEAIDKFTPLLLVIIPLFYERLRGRESAKDPVNT